MAIRINNALNLITTEIISNPTSWILGFSGGKDSTALLILTIRAMETVKVFPPNFLIIVTYCDTGVDIPTVRLLTKNLLNGFKKYCEAKKLPISFKISKPIDTDRFFVKVIGRGYVPPTNKFRWCTDRLRIKPVESIIKKYSKSDSKILLGVRIGESQERDRIIKKHSKCNRYFLTQKATKRTIFAPILDLNVTDIWNLIIESNEMLDGLQYKLLAQYRNASNECPMVRDPKSSPCGQGRFGCWTCTVVRKDKSVTNLIESGIDQLKPLLEFRNWLAEIRDLPEYREPFRRNGSKGLGPFHLKARKEILRRLRIAQSKSKFKLISEKEIALISTHWRSDKEEAKFTLSKK